MALGLIKEPTDTVVTCLSSTLDDVDQRVRNFSAIGLDSIGQAAKKAIPDLIKVLDDLVPEVCANAAEALGLIGTPSKQAVPSLLKLLLSQYAQVRGNATGALGRIGNPTKEIVFALMNRLNDIGKPAEPAIPHLTEKLRSGDIQIRGLSAIVLGNMGVVADLIQMLNDQNEKVRGMAAMALASIGEPAKSAVGADTNAE
mgnify:CR=1 FL=1